MKRPILCCFALFMAGIYVKKFLPQNIAALLFVAAVLCLFSKIIISRKIYTCIISALLVLSFVGGMFSVISKDASVPLENYINNAKLLTLRVAEKPETEDGYFVYICDTISVTDNETVYPIETKIRLTLTSDVNNLKLGDIFSAFCKITIPNDAMNRGGFDYRLYLKTKDIFYTGYIIGDEINIHSENNYKFTDYFKLLNIKLCDNIDTVFSEDNAILLKAMLLGDKSDMPSAYYSSFKRSGLSHIIAVSGLHLSSVIMILILFQKLFKIKRVIFSVFALCFICCFTLLTGMSVSVLRSAIMLSFIFAGNIFSRRSDPFTALATAGLIIAIENPYAIFSTSFILSFAATFGILLFESRAEKLFIPQKLADSNNVVAKIAKSVITVMCVSISAQLTTLPFSVYIFNEVSLWTLPANILISPLCPLILGTGFLFCIISLIYFPASYIIAFIASILSTVARTVINLFASLSFGVINITGISILMMMCFIVSIILIAFLLYKKNQLAMYTSVLLTVLLILNITNQNYDKDEVRVSFVNVGNGDCTLISLPDNINILIDGGSYSYSENKDVNNANVNNYLRQKGIDNIDFMIATHPHEDHTGGLSPVIDSFSVSNLIIPHTYTLSEDITSLLGKAKENGLKIYSFSAGSKLAFSDDITLTALMPDYNITHLSENNLSLVLRFDCYGTS